MIAPPEIIETPHQLTAMIPIIVPRDEIQTVMGPGIQEVMAAVQAQGLTPIGPWFTHHLHRPTDVFNFEICVPVASAITPVGRVQPSERPAMTGARTSYQGPYEGLGEAWGEFLDWIESEGHTEAEDLWERYVVTPHHNSDPATWQTELFRPLIGWRGQ